MPIANILSSYWSQVHAIAEIGFLMNDFLNFNEMRTEHRTENPIDPLIKRWNISGMSMKPQNSIS